MVLYKELKLKKLLRIMSLTLTFVLLLSTVAFASPDDEKQKLETEKLAVEQELIVAQQKMEEAHNIAEIARNLGLLEEDAIIVRAKELWATNNANKELLNAKLVEITTKIEHLAKYEYVGVFKLTGYCNCAKCCGHSSGKTASGTYPVEGRTVAASKQFPFGTRLYIEGLGEYVVEDRGGFASNVIDVYSNTHSGCYRAEYNQNAKVYIIKD